MVDAMGLKMKGLGACTGGCMGGAGRGVANTVGELSSSRLCLVPITGHPRRSVFPSPVRIDVVVVGA